MNQLSLLIKPASSLCNMRCKYCFYFDVAQNRLVESYGIMKEDIMKTIIERAFSEVTNGVINFSFQGGEPTLASLNYFYSFVDYVKKLNSKLDKPVNINYSIQTNGLLIDEKWCSMFKENNFLVGLSLDIMDSIHDNLRYDTNLNGTYKRVLETKNMFDLYNIEYNILSVLTFDLSKYPKEVYENIKNLDIKYIQFIPCLSSLDKLDNSIEFEDKIDHSISPKEFAYFYNTIFNLWKEDFLKGIYYSISLFDNIIPMAGGGYPPYICGLNGRCQNQLVIESNGDIYPCDFYSIDKYKLGNVLKDSFLSMLKSEIANNFIKEKPNVYEVCKKCRFYGICACGCKRMIKNMYLENDNYCGLKDFLDTNIESICYIWDIIKSNYRRI